MIALRKTGGQGAWEGSSETSSRVPIPSGEPDLSKRAETTDASITHRIQEMAERISGIEDTIEDGIHYPGNLGHYEKNKHK